MYSYRIEQAIRAATVLHKDVVRRGLPPLPYVTHPFAVAWMVRDYSKNENAIIAAFLHDVLEDTSYTATELEEDFGRDVRLLVESLTEPKENNGKPLSWKERKDAYHVGLKNAPLEALIIAAADKIHNMRCIVEQYFNDHSRFLHDFPGSLEERALGYQDLSNLLNRRLNNDIIGEFNHVYSEYKNFLGHVKRSQEGKG